MCVYELLSTRETRSSLTLNLGRIQFALLFIFSLTYRFDFGYTLKDLIIPYTRSCIVPTFRSISSVISACWTRAGCCE